MNMPYQIIKSDRKTIAIRIKPDGQVVVRCPKRMRIEQLRGKARELVTERVSMLKRADYVVACITHSRGSAYRCAEKARRQKKSVINL